MTNLNKNKWTRPNRVTIVISSAVLELPEGDILRPPLHGLSDLPADNRIRSAIEQGRAIWCLKTISRTGLDTDVTSFAFYPSQEAASEAMVPNGTVIDNDDFIRPKDKKFEVGRLSVEARISVAGLRGEAPYGLIYDALHGAGVYCEFEISSVVLSWIGDAGIEWLENEYGENWSAVAALEYCLAHFGSDALATLAARILVSEFVGQDDFDAGFASRELLMLVSGAEDEAIKSRNSQKERAKKGGASSSAKRLERLSMFMDELERLSPLVGQVSEERIVCQAWDNLKRANSNWPETPKIRFEYEVALRSQEPFKSRYCAVFSENA